MLDRYVSTFHEGIFIDPFVRNSPYKSICISNDIDPLISADYNMDALDFLKEIESTENIVVVKRISIQDNSKEDGALDAVMQIITYTKKI